LAILSSAELLERDQHFAQMAKAMGTEAVVVQRKNRE
jgi:hypothetical protein